MSTRARKIPELPTANSIAGADLLIVEKVANSTTSTTSKVTAANFVNYLITSPIGFGNVSGNIIPSSTATYNIGSDIYSWNNLYVSNTVFINNTAITINSNGDLVVGDTPQIGIISDTTDNWETANTILALGQAAINSNTFQIKIGDGSTAWHDLKYATMGQSYYTISPSMGGEAIIPSIPGQNAFLAASSGDITSNTYYGGYAVLYGGVSVGNTEIYEGGEGGGIAIFGGEGALIHNNTVIEDIYYTGDNDVHVTITNHNLYNGDKIRIIDVSTETTLNGIWYVEYQDDNNFRLCSNYIAYTGELIRLSSIGLNPWNSGGGYLSHSKNGGDLYFQAGYPNNNNFGKRGNTYIDGEYVSLSAVEVDISSPLGIAGDIHTLSTGSNINLNVANNIWTFANNGAFSVPGSINLSIGNIIQETDVSAPVVVADLTLSSTVDYSTGEGDNLAIGDYGLTTGIGYPWIVYEFTTTPSPALVLDDVISGEGIPVGSTVVFVGSGAYDKIVITNVAQPVGVPVAQPGITVAIARPIINAALAISTAANTNIALSPGANGFIINGSSIIPYESNLYDLGTPLRRFRTLWLGGSSIYIVDETLGVDQRLTARDGNFVVAGGAGLEVGEFTLRDNQILLANSARDIIVGSNNATGYWQLNRPMKVVSGSTGKATVDITRDGFVTINSPTIGAGGEGLNIVGSSDGSYSTIGLAGRMLHVTGNDGIPSRIENDAYGTGAFAGYLGRSARGTANTPTATQLGDTFARFGALGYGNSGWLATNVNSGPPLNTIDFVATENYTDTTAGSKIEFYVSPNNARTRTKALTISTDGLKYSDNTVQNTAFNSTSAVTKITVGTGLTQSGNTGNVGIDSTAVLAVAGTANQISVSNVGGTYTLSLPQNLNTNATVQFGSLTVNTITITGSSTTANTLSVTDKVIHLAANSTANTQINGGGFTLGNTASDYTVSILYDLPNDRWDTDGAGLKTLQLVANDVTIDSLTVYEKAHFGASYIGYDFTNAQIQADADVNSYAQIVIKNHSNGTDASADLIATNDLGDDTNYYIDMGINSSTYSNPDYNISGPNGGYLYNVGGDLSVGTATAAKVIKLFTGGTTSDKLRLTINDAGLTVVGNVSATTFVGGLSGTATSALTSNNSTYAYGKTEGNLNVNSASSALNANNATYLNGTSASGYQTTAGLSGNVATLTSNNSTYLNGKTEANLNVNSAVSALSSNNSAYLGGTVASGYQTTAGLSANVATLTSNNATYAYGKTEGNLNVNSASSSLTSNNAAYLGGTAAANYVNTTGNFSLAGNTTFNGIMYVNQISANGTSGTTGQILTSNGSDTYWSTPSVASVNTAAQYNWTNTHTFNANVTFAAEINVHNILANNVIGSNGQVLVANSADGMYWADLKSHKIKKVKKKDGSFDTDITANTLQDTMTFAEGTNGWISLTSDAVNQIITISHNPIPRTINFVIDGGGATPTTGSKGFVVVDFAGTINSWTILGDVAGNTVVDVKRSTYTGFPTTASIAGTAKPTLSGTVQKNQNTTLTGWGNTSLALGDVLEFNVDSAATVTRITVSMKVTPT